MPIIATFMQDEAVVFITFQDPWNSKDLKKSFADDLAYREKFVEDHPNQKVHMIVDVSQASMHAKDIQLGRTSPSFTHKSKGLVVVIGASMLTRRLVGVVMGVLNLNRYYFVNDLDEAIAIVRKEKRM